MTIDSHAAVRAVEDVFADHLRLRLHRDVEMDLERNYASDVEVLTSHGRLRGHDGIRTTAATLRRHCGDADYEYLQQVVGHDWAYLVWQVRAPGKCIHGGDSFRIAAGKIVLQTIHYVIVETAAE
jgi:hypothetical protein